MQNDEKNSFYLDNDDDINIMQCSGAQTIYRSDTRQLLFSDILR